MKIRKNSKLVEAAMKAWSRRLAEKIVRISSGSMAIEFQHPGQEVCEREIERRQKEILKKHRSAFWASGRNQKFKKP